MRVLEQSSLHSIEVVGREGFNAMAREWNLLVEANCDQPFFRHEYIRSWIDNFAPETRMKVLTGRDFAGRLVAALPLVIERAFMYGIPLRQLVSPTNVHSFRFDLIAADRGAAAHAFFEHLAADDSWDVIKITDVPEGGNAWQIYEEAAHAGFPVGAWESQRSPYIPLSNATLSSKFKSNLRRRMRRLEVQGVVAVECVRGGSNLLGRLEESFVIEQSGWKGRKGSAAAQSQSIRGFYSGLAHAAAAQDYFSLYFLKLNGKAIASQYGLTRDGVYSLLMTSYDESYKEHSPGHLLMEEVVKDCSARGLHEIDFLGCDLDWKLEWSRLVRFHHWLFIFRNNRLGRALRKAKFEWIPSAKQKLKSMRT